jgi:hypothetical protein
MADIQPGDYNTYKEINKTEVKDITKERYDEIKTKELQDSGLDVYEAYDDPQDADEIIANMEMENIIAEAEVEDIDNIQGSDAEWTVRPVMETQNKQKYVDKTDPAKQSNPTPGKAVSCKEITEANFSMGMVLSKYYTLGSLIPNKKHVMKDKTFDGITYNKFDYACNLKALAVNCLDKIRDAFPDWGMTITSTYRNDNTGKRSQHEIGQAGDIVFRNKSQKDYIKVAQWIQANLDYDQLLFEYRAPDSVWIHVSYNSKGNRNVSAPYPKYATFLNDKTYKRLALVTVPNFSYRT